MTRTTFRAGLTVACLWALSGTVNAALISGFSLLPTPDLFASNLVVNYDGAGGLMVTGFAVSFDDGTGAVNVDPAEVFSLSATLDGAGNLLSGSFMAGSLLSGNLTDFGFNDGGGDPLQFLFDVTGGDLAAFYGSLGGINLGFSGFAGDWGSPFKNGGSGVADINGVVPIPAAIWLLGAGLLSLAGSRLASTRRRTGR